MPTRCPICQKSHRDLFGLSLHIEDKHLGDQGRIVVSIATEPLPIIEVDIDQIYVNYGRRRLNIVTEG